MATTPSSFTGRRPSWSETDNFVPRRFVQPFQRFMHTETSGAIVMLVAAVAALVWANSPWFHAQVTLWEYPLRIELGNLAHVDLTMVEWVNDALMAVFFFLVGLEIKREMVHGELRDPKKAALPAIAALGGMITPAAIYMLFNAGGNGFHGWGVPMATDIAFAVAVVALVGSRVPPRGQGVPADPGHRRRHRRHPRDRHLLHVGPQPRLAGHLAGHLGAWSRCASGCTSGPCPCTSRSALIAWFAFHEIGCARHPGRRGPRSHDAGVALLQPRALQRRSPSDPRRRSRLQPRPGHRHHR